MYAEKKWNNSGITDTKIEPYENKYIPGSKRLPLTVVIDNESQWRSSRINYILEKTKEIFSVNCDISIAPITIVKIQHYNFNNLDCRNDFLFTADLPQGIHRPLVGLTNTLSCRYSGWGGYANPLYWEDHNKEDLSLDTAFIAYTMWENFYPRLPIAGDVLLAHELLHILLNRGHNQLNNNVLSSNRAKRGYEITESQCKDIRNHYLVKDF